jgi:hypothetical protein
MADLVTLFNSISRCKALRNNIEECMIYTIFAVIIWFGAQLFTDQSFSAVITLSAAVQCLGFCLLRMKVRKQRNVSGISSSALQLYVVTYLARLNSTLRYNGYLPVDRSGDWVYQTIDVAALLVVLSILFDIHNTHADTFESDHDSCDVFSISIACAIVAVFVHPQLNDATGPDVTWALALYVESIAMLPQLMMMTKKGGEVEALSSHYIACIFFARVMTLSFWSNTYVELLPMGSDCNLPGFAVLGAQIIQTVIFSDFMRLYFQHICTQRKLILPTCCAK